MGITTYNQGFKSGFHYVKGLPLVDKVGKVFWVGAGAAPAGGIGPSDGNPGTPLKPFATIKHALTRCTAFQADTIYVYPGHVENVTEADGLDFDVATVTVVFLGAKTNRARIKFSGSSAASMTISAPNVTLISPRFLGGIDALDSPIKVEGSGTTIIGGEYFDEGLFNTINAISFLPTAIESSIFGWRYYENNISGTQKESHIVLDDTRYVELVDIDIAGNFATANILNTGGALGDIRLTNIKLKNTNAVPAPGMVLVATTNGWAKNVDIRIASGTTFVSSVAAINWDTRCLGYKANGETGTPIAVYT